MFKLVYLEVGVIVELVTKLLEVFVAVYLVAAALFVVRVVRGPTLFDKLIAVDSLSYDLSVFMALIALYTGRHVLAVCIIAIALWAYALDAYISWYIVEEKSKAVICSNDI